MWTQGISWSLLGEPLGPVAQWGTCLDEARAFIAGVRSPPLRGGRAKVGWPCGKNPETTHRAVSSEGRGLRAREYGPDASRGYGMITEERTNRRWPNRDMLRSSASLSRGRAEPAPPRGGPSKLGRPSGEELETMRRVIFSEGRGLRVRVARPDASRGMA
jgi:hypothetical protein